MSVSIPGTYQLNGIDELPGLGVGDPKVQKCHRRSLIRTAISFGSG